MLLIMRLLDWESSTLTAKSLRLTPSFPKGWIEKNRTKQYAVQKIRLVIWLTMYLQVSLPRFQYKVAVLFQLTF